MPEKATLDTLFGMWCEGLEEAWRLAKGERKGELYGRRGSSFDGQGMHPYSRAWGFIFAIEKVAPGLAELRERTGDTPADPVLLRRLAKLDAERDFAGEVIAQDGIGVFS